MSWHFARFLPCLRILRDSDDFEHKYTHIKDLFRRSECRNFVPHNSLAPRALAHERPHLVYGKPPRSAPTFRSPTVRAAVCSSCLGISTCAWKAKKRFLFLFTTFASQGRAAAHQQCRTRFPFFACPLTYSSSSTIIVMPRRYSSLCEPARFHVAHQ